MMYRIFATAFAAGLFAAALISVIEVFTTTPLIVQAERYESASTAIVMQQPMAPADGGHVHDAEAWSPDNGMERFLYTLLANAVTGIAFSLVLVVGLTVGARKADLTKGLLIALVGFTAFTLSPVLGLPPELPGMPVADLQLRQLWWASTIALTLGALGCLFVAEAKSMKVLGVVLLIAPHVWGAPHAVTHDSLVPATLASQFAATSIVINALFWMLLGIFAPLFYARFKGEQSA